MKIYDISQELTNCAVYPGDMPPKKEIVSDMSKGDLYNLTNLRLCAHNGTHVDAPFHFLQEGKTISELALEKCIGPCLVVCHEGEFTGQDAKKLLQANRDLKRILIRGNATVSAEAAKVFAEHGLWLVGNESQTVGPAEAPMEVHKILLSAEVVLLEGIRLSEVEEGAYFLCAAPINIEGGDGAPCRAVLIQF